MKRVVLAIALVVGCVSAGRAEITIGHNPYGYGDLPSYSTPRYRYSSSPSYVRPYYRSNGSYVPGHYRSNPDGYFYNNWSTSGNVNPYTGQSGYRTYPSNYYGYPSYGPYYYGR